MAPLDPESYLESLELVGWRLGLERMHKLNALLGMPQHRFASIHVVGTNGKSSVARMTGELLSAHGLSVGVSLSPHVERWSERVLIGGEEIGPAEFAGSVGRAAEAAAIVDRGLDEGEAVTQFEVATAAAFLALAGARVDAGVIEAGLGGRLDATNTIPSRVAVLTSVGLDHTEWLGETEEAIAAEKLAVLRDHSTLVVGRVSEVVRALAERTAAERGAELVLAPEVPATDVPLSAPGGFQRRNFALACAAAEAFLGAVDPIRVGGVAARISIPGRLERVAEDPPTYLDVAHNPDGAAALAEAVPEVAGGRPVVACLAVLRDKDAAAMIAALAPALDRLVCTELPADGPKDQASLEKSARRRCWGARELARLGAEAGVEAEAEDSFGAAVARAREAAVSLDGALLLTGSHYILGPARAALVS